MHEDASGDHESDSRSELEKADFERSTTRSSTMSPFVYKETPSLRKSLISNICEFLKPRSSWFVRSPKPLLPLPQVHHKSTLVLDLDETLVHTSFTQIPCDFRFQVIYHFESFIMYVCKRPGLDSFLKKCTDLFEVVIFTASQIEYANPVIDAIDPEKKISHRLFRNSCSVNGDNCYKDLSRLGRGLEKTCIIDVICKQNTPMSYALQPDNAIPIKTWTDDPYDVELENLEKYLEKLAKVKNIPQALTEIKQRNWEISEAILNKIIEDQEISQERASFNSPVKTNSKRFNFSL